MDCKHEIEKLIGTADGIICKGCGMKFDSIPKQAKAAPIPEAEPEEPQTDPEAETEAAPVKRGRKKKGEN